MDRPMAHGRQSGKYDIFYPHPFPMPSGVGFLFGVTYGSAKG